MSIFVLQQALKAHLKNSRTGGAVCTLCKCTVHEGKPTCSGSVLRTEDALGKRSLLSVGSVLYNLLEPRDEEETPELDVYDDLELDRQKGSLLDRESITSTC